MGPKADSVVDADAYYYGLGGYGLGYAGYGHGYGLGYSGYGLGYGLGGYRGYAGLGYAGLGYAGHYIGKRSADAEPEADADGYYGHGYGVHRGYYGHGYGHGY